GIRDFHVTGVQTCALPISAPASARHWEIQDHTSGTSQDLTGSSGRGQSAFASPPRPAQISASGPSRTPSPITDRPMPQPSTLSRSEERRVGTERTYQWIHV